MSIPNKICYNCLCRHCNAINCSWSKSRCINCIASDPCYECDYFEHKKIKMYYKIKNRQSTRYNNILDRLDKILILLGGDDSAR